MHYTFCAQTDPGRVRNNNEDAAAFDEATGVAVLADGMGGYNAGEVASGMATASIKTSLVRWLSNTGQPAALEQIRRAMALCVEEANRAIFDASRTQAQYAGMGTTLVVAVFQADELMLGHIGDSRCYRWRGSELVQLTRDHSLVQERIDAGLMTPAQAAISTNKNLVTRALGVDAAVTLELHQHRVEVSDIYLLCSDGLSDMVDPAEIAAILQQGSSLAPMAAELVSRANQHGGRDNITVLLAQATAALQTRGLISSMLGK